MEYNTNFLDKKEENRKRGKEVEDLFFNLLNSKKRFSIRRSTKEEDIQQHFDFVVNDKKIDVKAEKSTGFTGCTYQILEILNVKGNMGWLYGKADLIAFQSGSTFLLCDRSDLVDYHLNNTKQNEKVYQLKEAINKVYSRNYKDLITVFSLDVFRKMYRTWILK